ncbi:HTTM domain-containing protein [Adhaeribacter radiodurans]|uniref:HTTM domain-containing protein n=1 Tax=Adhaeribacter radiodurans TaxID=2745197 RepID=A0A7L7LF33_9BACT|nr:HTTM domain-containing protein [Adhaeribacter radiodurans]QMU31105.1 HTTM domain-containing protein [Adhaeribacter radiodurans]
MAQTAIVSPVKFHLLTWLRQPVDNSPLIFFRLFFGLLLALEASGAIATGWVKRNFIDPTVHLPFIGFEWLKPLPGNGMYYYYGLMAVLGLLILFGVYYRASLAAYTFMWWATYLMQKVSYNNHYYLLILLCFLMLLVPANAYASWDARRNPAIRSLSCPRWCLAIFAAQIGIVYTFAAIAKIYPDWLQAMPIKLWFSVKAHYPLIGPLLQKHELQVFIAYGGILFDLLITPFLLWRKSRKWAFIVSLFFHLFNSTVFQVGIFPYIGIALSVFFFNPETIRRIFFRRKPALSVTDTQLNALLATSPTPPVFYLLGVYFIIQLLLPIRHWFIPGDVHWTEEGHRMAWQMMLRAKTGTIYFEVRNPITGQSQTVYPTQFLTSKQASVLPVRPDLIWQFAQFLKQHYQKQGYQQVQVFAFAQASLNGRPYQPFVDSKTDLAAVPWEPFKHANWILSYKK